MPSRVTKTAPCLLIAAFLMLLNAACKKHTSTDDPGKPTQPDIYVLGTIGDSLICWKNGEARHLYSQTKLVYVFGSPSLFVADNDVFISGNKPNNNPRLVGSTPVYWRNDAAIVLPDSTGDATATSIFVYNSDVYVAGTSWYLGDTARVPYTSPTAIYPKSGNVATLWKNGAPVSLPGFFYVGLTGGGQYAVSAYNDYVSSLYVSGNDVYVAGGSRIWGHKAGYWKNGVPVDLTKGLIYKDPNGRHCYPTTTSIFASNNDVYVTGYQMTGGSFVNPTAIYWKNGLPVFLTTDSTSGSVASAIHVSGNDVHIAGYQNINNYARAMYWKNGVATPLTTGVVSSVANSIFVTGDDVYIAGYQWIVGGKLIAAYWKNGKEVKLTNGTTPAIATGIFVK
jgi:hypothetical protein